MSVYLTPRGSSQVKVGGWHTNTQKAKLIGTCRTGMREECQQQQSSERLRANCGASSPSGLRNMVLMTQRVSFSERETHRDM